MKIDVNNLPENDYTKIKMVQGSNRGMTMAEVADMEAASVDYLNLSPDVEIPPPRKQDVHRHYGVHPYFTRRSWNVVQAFIGHFTKMGDTVLDPFGGSGVTAIEALVMKRRAIHLDINPLANFIAQSVAVAPVDLEALQNEYNRVMKECKPLARKLEDLTEEQAAELPIRDWYPKNVRLPSNADRAYVHELFSPKQLRLLARLLKAIRKTGDEQQRGLLLYVFSATVTKSNLLMISAKGRNPSRGGASPTQIYRYYVPPDPPILDPLSQFNAKFSKFLEMKAETNDVIGDYYHDRSIRILKGDATKLPPFIKPESVDYVYTDPPYGANIAYLDLSTMWNGWLGFEVSDEDRRAEVIENGDLQKTRDDYVQLLRQSITEIFRVLRWDRWFSLVFAHKDVLFWDTIIKTAQDCGFEYKSTSVVKAGIVSYHKHKNPLRVLSGELVINFQKKKNPIAIAVSRVAVEAVKIVLDSAENTIVGHVGGATTDLIHAEMIPRLIEGGKLSELSEQVGDLTTIIGDKFDYNHLTGRWFVPLNTKLGSYIGIDKRILFYVESFLNNCERRGEKATFDKIWSDLMPKLKNGRQPTHQLILHQIGKIAEPYEGQYWRLKSEWQEEIFHQEELMGKIKVQSDLPEWKVDDETTVAHNEIIYRLAQLGKAAGYIPYIGLNERSDREYASHFEDLGLGALPKEFKAARYTRKKVEQIDLILFDSAGFPAYAFEVEMSTSITSAIERFIELMKAKLVIEGKRIIICPFSRRGKLDEVLSQSAFIGAPLFMENKIQYLYVSDILKIYTEARTVVPSKEFLAVTIRKHLHSPLKED